MIARFFRNRFGQGRGGGQGRSQGGGQGRGGGAGGGRGRGGDNKPGSGPGGNCVCPQCGKKVPHIAGQRCVDMTCPDCSVKMIRE